MDCWAVLGETGHVCYAAPELEVLAIPLISERMHFSTAQLSDCGFLRSFGQSGDPSPDALALETHQSMELSL